ncbi:hypothetical protein [Brachybacterium sp. UMB0905]|uniref:hypothetical protein n=1 Tax=Brachybacterium sp. UMB0905 TaxID=2069310 RepID=UPI000C7F9776|nr:hypothetical protein [Brachybacterium sp. UMB0905]PMC76669.1 hypothetical protein CJ197_02775 [Brachybacterium sp. UMB0905]
MMRSARDTARTMTTRRTALAGLGTLGVVSAASACSLLPGLGGEKDPVPSGGGKDQPEPSDGGEETTPADPFVDWATIADLESVEVDLVAADERYGTTTGTLERKDRFGSWTSLGFPEDSPMRTDTPRAVDPAALEVDDEKTLNGFSSNALRTNAVVLLDTPLLFEADNGRYEEVAPAVLEPLGLADVVDPANFHQLFENSPVSASPDPEQGLPELFGIEPAPYDPEAVRMHVLSHGMVVDRNSPQFEGNRYISTVLGATPVTLDGEERILYRTSTFMAGIDDPGSMLYLGIGIGYTVGPVLEDPLVLPVLAASEVPSDWVEHTKDQLTMRLPADLGDPEDVEVTLHFGGKGASNFVMHHRIGATSPYPLSDGTHAVRGEVDGAELAVVAAQTMHDGSTGLWFTIHGPEDTYWLRITDLTEDEAATLAPQILGGLRLTS